MGLLSDQRLSDRQHNFVRTGAAGWWLSNERGLGCDTALDRSGGGVTTARGRGGVQREGAVWGSGHRSASGVYKAEGVWGLISQLPWASSLNVNPVCDAEPAQKALVRLSRMPTC
jgi:hypothetical protein